MYVLCALVAQSCPTLCDCVDCSPSGSSVQGILQARKLKWVAIPPGELPSPRTEPRPPTLQADSLPAKPPGKPRNTRVCSLSLLQGIFLTQESNWGLLHCTQLLYQLSYQGSPMLYIFYHKNLAILLSKLSSIHPFSASYF